MIEEQEAGGAGDRDDRQLADKLESESDRMDRRTSELEDQVGKVRDDWERKRRDDSVPGAEPPDHAEEGPPPEAEEPPDS